MSSQAKTIQIFLPHGNPRGIRSAEMTTRTVRVIEVPRVHIKEFLSMPDASQVGLYFLVSSSELNGKPQLYIGQTGELRNRIQQHNLKKDFWERAFVMLSTNNTITQTHALYLEYKAIETALKAERYELLNGNTGMLPHTPEPLKADCEELFYTLSILLSTMGQPIFESLQTSIQAEKTDNSLFQSSFKKEVFTCRPSYANAQGFFDDDGFVILKGSLIRKDTPKELPSWIKKTKDSLLKKGTLIEHDNENYQMTENHLCKTPSGAAQFVLGRKSNGWVEWINSKGETLDIIYRQTSD